MATVLPGAEAPTQPKQDIRQRALAARQHLARDMAARQAEDAARTLSKLRSGVASALVNYLKISEQHAALKPDEYSHPDAHVIDYPEDDPAEVIVDGLRFRYVERTHSSEHSFYLVRPCEVELEGGEKCPGQRLARLDQWHALATIADALENPNGGELSKCWKCQERAEEAQAAGRAQREEAAAQPFAITCTPGERIMLDHLNLFVGAIVERTLSRHVGEFHEG